MNVVLVVIATTMQHVQIHLEVIIAHARSAILGTIPPVKVRKYLYNKYNITNIYNCIEHVLSPIQHGLIFNKKV